MSGFSALPAGNRNNNGDFNNANFWSASEYDSSGAYYMDLYYHLDYASLDNYGKDYARSVRCLRDSRLADGGFNEGHAEGGSGDVGGGIATRAKGKVKTPSARDIDMGS